MVLTCSASSFGNRSAIQPAPAIALCEHLIRGVVVHQPAPGRRVDQPASVVVNIDQHFPRDSAVRERDDPPVAVQLRVDNESRRQPLMHGAEIA